MTYEQRAIDLAKQLDQMDGKHTTEAMDDQLHEIGELCGGLSVHGFEEDLKQHCEDKAQRFIDCFMSNLSVDGAVYDELYVDTINDWYLSATAIMAQTSQQVAA